MRALSRLRSKALPETSEEVFEGMVEAARLSTGGQWSRPQLRMNLREQIRPRVARRHCQVDSPRTHTHLGADLQQPRANGGRLRRLHLRALQPQPAQAA